MNKKYINKEIPLALRRAISKAAGSVKTAQLKPTVGYRAEVRAKNLQQCVK